MQDGRAYTGGRPANLGQLSASRQFDEAEAEMRPREQRPAATVSGIISHAESVHAISLDRLASLSGLTGRAINLAARLAGPFPVPAPDAPEKTRGDEPAVSALDDAQRRVAELRRPLVAMDLEFARLSEALDAIERAFG
ncbi:hypothetical protein MRF4_17110 [Methylobacterium radiotolerans]|uniref:hypothetical protein n=1 Tax=Methylobacterium TaxID=407 RepID=UPI002F2DE784